MLPLWPEKCISLHRFLVSLALGRYGLRRQAGSRIECFHLNCVLCGLNVALFSTHMSIEMNVLKYSMQIDYDNKMCGSFSEGNVAL